MKKVWVGVLKDNEGPEFYIPMKYDILDVYKGPDAVPYFNTIEECEQWCNNKNANADISDATLHITMNREEAQQLLNCLLYPDPKGKDLDMQLEMEEILANYLNASK